MGCCLEKDPSKKLPATLIAHVSPFFVISSPVVWPSDPGAPGSELVSFGLCTPQDWQLQMGPGRAAITLGPSRVK